jgi:hypothetical protein
MFEAIAPTPTNIAHVNNHPFSFERSTYYRKICNNPLIAILSAIDDDIAPLLTLDTLSQKCTTPMLA